MYPIHAAPAPQRGYLAELDAQAVGFAAAEMGAGRAHKGDAIDNPLFYRRVSSQGILGRRRT